MLTPLGPEQTTSLLVVLILSCGRGLEPLSLDGGQLAGFEGLGFPLKIAGNPGVFWHVPWEPSGKPVGKMLGEAWGASGSPRRRF